MRSVLSPRRPVFLVSLVAFVLLFIFMTHNQTFSSDYIPGHSKPKSSCPDRPIAHDVVLVLKTGASELPNRLPVHIETSLRCAPNVLIISDTEQEFQGLHVYDALDDLERTINNASDPDSTYHRTLREAYREGKSLIDLDRDAAWKIDRFKNIPMLKMAYEKMPMAKWLVFVDADTWLLWDNLLHFLGQLDHRKPMYLGSPVDGSEGLVFGHGGSGYIVSRVAARTLVEASDEAQKRYFKMAKDECCGDAVFGRAFRENGIILTSAWPSIQGESLAGLAYDANYWCHAAITFHHMSSEDLVRVQKTVDTAFKNTTPRYADIFNELIWPDLKAHPRRTNWDSNCRDKIFEPDDKKPQPPGAQPFETMENCRAACEADKKCLQFAFRVGWCGLSKWARLGYESKENITSEWNLDRIDKFKREHSSCGVKWTY